MDAWSPYGMEVSGHQSRARSYLIKADIPFHERGFNTAHYMTEVLPKAGGLRTMPTLEFADGTVIRDSNAIIDHFEEKSGNTFSPSTPKQRFFSYLFDVVACEGLLRPGMHYRWNFDAENRAFLESQTRLMLPKGLDGVDQILEAAHNQMRAATKKFGVNPDTYGLIEELYAEQLAAFDAHFSAYPYLLGGRPCRGDFGLMIWLHPHLGRDPKPLSIMQKDAMAVLRYTERMNQRESDWIEFPNWEGEDAYLENDEIPDTLVTMARVMAEDFVPETLAAAEAINTWLFEEGEKVSDTFVERGLGFGEFDLRGKTISALAQPYRFYRLKRAQDEYDAMGAEDKRALEALLDACNMRPILDAKLSREIGWKDNREIWL
ncbi:MAG: glutathione S-transferase family protein [Pseudomonadota bacterium]